MSQSVEESGLFKPLSSLRSSERIADVIRRAIVAGKLGAGQVLPPERTLAARFRVTRNTVREALRQLEQLRLVSIRQGSGVTVRDYLESAGLEFLAVLLTAETSIELMRDVLEARAVIGEAICCRAIDTFAIDEIEDFKERVEVFAEEALRPKPDLETLQALEFDAHTALMQGCGNRAFLLIYNSLRHVYEPVADLFAHLMDNPAQLAELYREAAAALAGDDRETAKRCFRQVFAMSLSSQQATGLAQAELEEDS